MRKETKIINKILSVLWIVSIVGYAFIFYYEGNENIQQKKLLYKFNIVSIHGMDGWEGYIRKNDIDKFKEFDSEQLEAIKLKGTYVVNAKNVLNTVKNIYKSKGIYEKDITTVTYAGNTELRIYDATVANRLNILYIGLIISFGVMLALATLKERMEEIGTEVKKREIRR